MKFLFSIILVCELLYSQTKISYRTQCNDDYFANLNLSHISSDTLKIFALMVEFQIDTIETTNGNGQFDSLQFNWESLEIDTSKILDKFPHNKTYFEDHLLFAKNYFQKVSNGKLVIEYQVLDSVVILDSTMEKYSPPHCGDNFSQLDSLLVHSWKKFFQTNNFPQLDSNSLFIIFHSGIGRDINFSSTYGYDPFPHDIPSIYRKLKNKIYVKNFPITHSIILPETESRVLPSSFGDAFVNLGMNGMLVSSIANYLGLPDLFDTETGRSGIGRFGLMDGEGIFSWSGFFPPEMSVWEKYFLKWIEPVEIKNSETKIRIPAINFYENNDTVFKIPITQKEYFFIENRNRDARNDSVKITLRIDGNIVVKKIYREQKGFSEFSLDSIYGNIIDVDEFDFSLPGGYDSDSNYYNGGILIWHIDENIIEQSFYTNTVNADKNFRGVDLEQSGAAQSIGEEINSLFGSYIGSGSAFDFWFKDNPIRKKKMLNEFSNTSFPNSKSNFDAISNISIKNFSKDSCVMYFDVDFKGEISRIKNFPKFVGEKFGTNSVRFDTDKIVFITNGISSDANFQTQNKIDNSTLFIYTKDGSSYDSLKLFSASNFTPIILNNTILVASKNKLYKIGKNIDNYIISDSVEFDSQINSNPIANNSWILISTENKISILDFNLNNISSINLSDTIIATASLNLNNKFIVSNKNGFVYEIFITENNRISILDSIDMKEKILNFVVAQNDSSQKIILGYSNNGKIFLAKNFLNTFSKIIDIGDSLFSSPILSDINEDGRKDILVLTNSKIFAFEENGVTIDNFPISLSHSLDFFSQPLVCDIDGDNSNDVFCVSSSGVILAFNKFGKILDGFPILSGKNFSTSAIFSYEDSIFIFLTSDDGNIYGFKKEKNNSTFKSSWTQFQHNEKSNGFIDFISKYVPISNEFFPIERAYNYPNPVYDDKTFIRFFVNEDAIVEIKIFDLSGDLIFETEKNAIGNFDNEIEWNVSQNESGIYFAHLFAKGNTISGEKIIKIAVVK